MFTGLGVTCYLGWVNSVCKGTKYSSRSDIVPVLNLPSCDIDGGHASLDLMLKEIVQVTTVYL